MFSQLLPALRMTLLLSVVTGLIYPSAVTGLCQLFFKNQANGSLIKKNGQIIGSTLIGQTFTKPGYFHGRPSAAGADGYDPTASGGSNLGPTSRKLYDRVKGSANQFRKENPDFKGSIPADALTASGSGLDPDISLGNAEAQLARVAQARGVDAVRIQKLLRATAENRDLGFLGEPRVNVLKLNLALDQQFPHRD
ncbi:MAG: K(+)-transporting ATPase subunit C [Acidobacteriota bacterium]|nr:K(+)-transporting ATPase subunit C [Acidobacteriota bacterium]